MFQLLTVEIRVVLYPLFLIILFMFRVITKHILSTVLHALAEFSFLYIDKNNIISIISLLKIEINNEIDQFI
jgi:hypothetical protein